MTRAQVTRIGLLRAQFAAVLLAFLVAVAACTDGGNSGHGRRGDTRGSGQASALRWQRGGLGMSSSFLPSGGRLLATDDERVYAASGFGRPAFGDSPYTVTALARDTGETRWSLNRPSPPFLQGVAAGILLVNEQYDVLLGIDAATGAERWHLDLSTIGLGRYGATVSAIRDGVAAMGLSAGGEGDTRPPVVVGIDPTNGRPLWRTNLAAGTDLNFGTPVVAGDAVVFLSTPSHPGSAPASMAHAVDPRDGVVRWSIEIGGGQGFHARSAAVSSAGVHIPGPDAVITVDAATGEVRWRRGSPAPAPAMVGSRLWLWEAGRIVTLDPLTGQELASYSHDGPLGDRLLIAPPQGGGVLAIDPRQGRALNPRDPAVFGSQDWPAPLVDVPLVSRDLLVVATGDQGVTAYDTRKLFAHRAKGSPTTVSQQPRFTGEAAKIAKAVSGWLNAETVDGSVANIEDGERLRSTIQQATANVSAGAYKGRVDEVNVVSGSGAFFTFSILSRGTVVLNRWQGRAVRVGARWKVSRDTYCHLIGFSGISCPPR